MQRDLSMNLVDVVLAAWNGDTNDPEHIESMRYALGYDAAFLQGAIDCHENRSEFYKLGFLDGRGDLNATSD